MPEIITKISKNKGNVSVRDHTGNIFVININDLRYLNKEFIPMNRGRVHIDLRGKFYAKNKEGEIFSIDKTDERYVNGELICVTKKNKPKKEIIKVYKERKEVDEIGRKTMSNSQINYQLKKRREKYRWSNNYEKFHRSNFMKYKIKNENNKDKTENEIMTEQGFNKIFGTGNIKYEYINKI